MLISWSLELGSKHEEKALSFDDVGLVKSIQSVSSTDLLSYLHLNKGLDFCRLKRVTFQLPVEV